MGSLSTLLRLARDGKRDELKALVTRGLFPAWAFRANEQVIVRLTRPRPLPRALPQVAIRPAGPDDEPLFQAIRPRKGGYGVNFQRGSIAFLGEVSGEPAAFGWFELGERHRSRTNGYTFALGPRAAWAWGIEIEPRFRLSGIFHKYWVETLPALAERGIDEVLGSIQSDNPLSINSHRRLGFELLYALRVVRALGATWHRADPGEGTGLPASRGLGPWHGAAH
ncbi:MAG: hypothetical protein MUF27_02750 [Acidobacteria bacterium]|nr:hypothetical protein [Acidobacteriota bacterium]